MVVSGLCKEVVKSVCAHMCAWLCVVERTALSIVTLEWWRGEILL